MMDEHNTKIEGKIASGALMLDIALRGRRAARQSHRAILPLNHPARQRFFTSSPRQKGGRHAAFIDAEHALDTT
jgi:hypothetical protein